MKASLWTFGRYFSLQRFHCRSDLIVLHDEAQFTFLLLHRPLPLHCYITLRLGSMAPNLLSCFCGLSFFRQNAA